ncbi:MAG: pyridoxamine 5'-phosphate oxidase family protein [Chloroflexi bacterium]|nr:pyridoxamine 5'-phosphate oxidase family protein [Chloroflexota bacterium]
MTGSNDRQPTADRPYAPGYGFAPAEAGLLPWSWAEERLAASRNYWVTTTRPGGAPHAMPVWGVWANGRLYFSSGAKSRKAKNLAADPRCVIHTESGSQAVIVEGIAVVLPEAEALAVMKAPYKEKYDWEMTGGEGPIFAVEPRVAFGFIESYGGSADQDATESQFTQTATRWRFER